MGGSSGGSFGFRISNDTEGLQRQAIENAAVEGFQMRLSEIFGRLLTTYNDRDHVLVSKRLEMILAALKETHDGPFDRLFGGSVAKHTYVDGLSDIDCLIKLNDSTLHGHTPAAALGSMADIIRQTVEGATVEVGSMAVTVRYGDGMELQLLPAVDDGSGRLQVPAGNGTDWSRINPQTFRTVLAQRNEMCGQKLVPTIKLAKAILGTLPEGGMLSGYHLESLAIEAFRGYDGVKSTAAMLPTFFERARTLVLEPIRDSTGQSVHVDADLGPPNSSERQEASFTLGRLARQMRTASVVGSEARWLDFFGLEE